MEKKSINDKHAEITERLIAELERGCAPWARPWSGPTLPRNIVSGRPYRGMNILFLWMVQAQAPYPTGEWLSFRQALQLGGHVRKGEHGVPVFFFCMLEREDEKVAGGVRHIPMPRTYTVFNVAQCENVPVREEASFPLPELFAEAERFIAAVGAKICHGADQAYYDSQNDEIRLPSRKRFDAPELYFATALHECAHWSGAKHRLAREFGERFGDAAYAFEELVAELTSAYLCAELGMPGVLRHPEYLAEWVRILRADPRVLMSAGARASEAADYLARFAGRRADESLEDAA